MKYSPSTPKIKTQIILLIACILVLILSYLCHGTLILFRLNEIGSHIVKFDSFSEFCLGSVCEANWTFKARHRFLISGNILRSHVVIETESGRELAPIVRTPGIERESWTRLRVYELKPNSLYSIRASKPAKAAMGWFVGVRPRTTDSRSVISVPEVTNFAVAFTTQASLVLLVIFGLANHFGNRGALLTAIPGQGNSKALFLAAAFATVAATTSIGYWDSLLPEGDFRAMTIRLSLLTSIGLFIISNFNSRSKKHELFTSIIASIVLFTLGVKSWSLIQSGPNWAICIAIFVLAGAYTCLKRSHVAAAILMAAGWSDALRILGFLDNFDYPPIYVANITICSAFTLVTAKEGGLETLLLVGSTYRKIKKDNLFRTLRAALEATLTASNTESRLLAYQNTLPIIAAVTGARKVTTTLHLPFSRPFTVAYDATDKTFQSFDDEHILGDTTLRTMIYGHEEVLSPFGEFSLKTGTQPNTSLTDAKYFSTLRVAVNHNPIGAIILTRFNDAAIDRYLHSESQKDVISELKDSILRVKQLVNDSVSMSIASDFQSNSERTTKMQQSLRNAIAKASSIDCLFAELTTAISDTLNVRTLLHKRSGHRAFAVCCSGLSPNEWSLFTEYPLRIEAGRPGAFGPTAVAFTENKGSYIKDIRSILPRLHPRTQMILGKLDSTSMAAIPINANLDQYVLTVLSSRAGKPFDPDVLAVLLSSSSLIAASIDVLEQKGLSLVLGEITTRLIADQDIQNSIIEAAKQKSFPSIIGSPRTSFLLLIDLVGSSSMKGTAEDKAKIYGTFYDEVNNAAKTILDGFVRKTIGDAVIISWDGGNSSLDSQTHPPERLCRFSDHCHTVAKQLGLKGIRSVLHHGSYYFGLIGTSTFGQIDIIGSAIDEICKAESILKCISIANQKVGICVTESAKNALSATSSSEFECRGFIEAPCSSEYPVKLAYIRPQTQHAEVSNDNFSA